jgi:ATP-dependent exoDNAse (exonuclease V) beta subunit
MINLSTPNLQILANAGSGKTHTLVTRIIRLLMLGVHPRRIIALTFTRKAAGEFLTKLLQRIASAALDPKAAKQLSADIRLEHDCADYQRLLRRVVQNLGKLQLTTLDSFFNRVVSAFPQELGLSGSPKLLAPHAEELAGASALRHALGKLTPEESNLLLQSLFERDEGSAPGSASKDLHTFRREVHESFLNHPQPEAWGNPMRLWGEEANPWKSLAPADLQSCREIVEKETGSPTFTSEVMKSWLQLLSLIRGAKGNAVTKRIIDSLDSWKQGTGSFLHRKVTFEVSAEASRAAAALAEHYLHECSEYRLREARAVHHLLSLYEKEYDAEVRSRGLLTFSDVTALLQPASDFLGLGRDPRESSPLRLQLDERLDVLFDHWLLDEFQDTSRNQYRALENILDEVISEAARGGERSFFCVGDIKQAIYGWRKGDSRLFDELYERYRRGEAGLKREPLNISWRSSEEILRTLNAIFGDLNTTAPTLPESVRERWQNAWAPHQRSTALPPLPGYFSWLTYRGEKEEERHLDMQERVISLLAEMAPRLSQGMTIALLVRSGKEAHEWLEVLRSAGIEALSESNPPVGRDNPVAAALRSALSLSVHPGDSFAKNHLLMEPLRGIFLPENNPDEEITLLIRHSAQLLAEGGFCAVVEWLLEKLSPLIRDSFSQSRAAALRRAAIHADSSDLTNMDDFLNLLTEYEEQGRSAPQAVQVMTIHKSKGLEYDMVLLPIPGRQEAINSFSNSKIDCWQNSQGEPFLMKLPAEEIRNVPGNETLAFAAELKKEEGAFEELCVWYVAMSRAKQALYLFSQEPKKLEPEKCPTFPHLLAAGLKNLGEFQNHQLGDAPAALGDPLWHENYHPKPAEPERDPLPSAFSIHLPGRPPALEKTSPSDAGHEMVHGAQAFLANNATALGSEIHAFFQSIDWLHLEAGSWELGVGLNDASPEARGLIQSCLRNPAIQDLFQKPEAHAELWREQRFDLLQGDLWLSGCFDRVLIFRDSQGRAIGADLIDFKTDQGGREKLLTNYRAQMESYRHALSRLIDLPEAKIRMILLHLRSSAPVVVLE